jgi:ankyrin repeat protein
MNYTSKARGKEMRRTSGAKERLFLMAVLAVLVAPSAHPQTTNFLEVVQTGTPQDVKAAIGNGADVNVRDLEGYTPLMYACFNVRFDLIPMLLKAGADINAQNAFGNTALMIAAMYNSIPDGIIALLDAGADAKLKNNKAQTAFDLAKMNWQLEGTEAYRRLQQASE